MEERLTSVIVIREDFSQLKSILAKKNMTFREWLEEEIKKEIKKNQEK